jgi:hypothetical protein
MGETSTCNLSDLVLNRCPLGCDGKCAGVWIKEITNHRIICRCGCKHRTLARVWDPATNAITRSSSSSEETKENEF